jgi:hypothetical protein
MTSNSTCHTLLLISEIFTTISLILSLISDVPYSSIGLRTPGSAITFATSKISEIFAC